MSQVENMGPRLQQILTKAPIQGVNGSKYELSPRLPSNSRPDQEPIRITSLAQFAAQLAREGGNDVVLNGVPYRLTLNE